MGVDAHTDRTVWEAVLAEDSREFGVFYVFELGRQFVAGDDEQFPVDGVVGGGKGFVLGESAPDGDEVGDPSGEGHHGGQAPTMTPMARLWVATTTTTVATMTVLSLLGIRFKVDYRMLCQSMVATEIMIITATSAAMGITETRSPSPTTRISRKTPARKVEIRVRVPDAFTLIMVWPITAHRSNAAEEPG